MVGNQETDLRSVGRTKQLGRYNKLGILQLR